MKRAMAALLALLLALTACGNERKGGQGKAYSVYYAVREPVSGGESIGSEDHTLPTSGEPVEQLVALLLGSPESGGLMASVPSGVALSDWSIQDGVLSLKLSEGYGGLSGIDLTIADYCITLTLCQLDEVRAVTISTGGSLSPSRYYPSMRTSDVLLSAMEDDLIFLDIDLYFPNGAGSGLVAEQRDVLTGNGVTRSTAVMNALTEGPKSEGLKALMPADAELLSTLVDNGVCYVNFNAAFGEAPAARTKEGGLLLYAIVNTLCSLSGVDQVQLLIEGEAPVFYGGVSTLTPLKPDFSMVIK